MALASLSTVIFSAIHSPNIDDLRCVKTFATRKPKYARDLSTSEHSIAPLTLPRKHYEILEKFETLLCSKPVLCVAKRDSSLHVLVD